MLNGGLSGLCVKVLKDELYWFLKHADMHNVQCPSREAPLRQS